MGFQAEVEDIDDNGKAAVYVSKYIGKSLAGHKLPSHFRRVRCSQNWEALAQLEAHERSSEFDWMVCNSSTALWACVEQCQQERRDMIDGATGEFFDYSDSVANWY